MRRVLSRIVPVLAAIVLVGGAWAIASGQGASAEPVIPVTPGVETDTGTVTEDGVREFDLTAHEFEQTIANFPLRTARVWGYNGSTPGPTLVAYEGETLRVNVTNELEVPTTVHFHGGHTPASEDGVAGVTQVDLVDPGETYTYEFTPGHIGTFAYHSHTSGAVQELRGLVGMFVVLPREVPADEAVDRDFIFVNQEFTFMEEGQLVEPFPSHFMFHTLNGQTVEAAGEPIKISEGDRIRVRVYNASNGSHSMHLHGHDLQVVSKNGHPIPTQARWEETTQNVAPGDFFELEWTADNPGNWLFHCHFPHHTTNAHQSGWKGGPAGMTRIFHYEGAEPVPEEFWNYQGSGEGMDMDMGGMDMGNGSGHGTDGGGHDGGGHDH